MQHEIIDSSGRRRSLATHRAGVAAVALGLMACSGTADHAGPDEDAVRSAAEEAASPATRVSARSSTEALSSLEAEVDTVLLSASVADEYLAALGSRGIDERFARVSELAGRTLAALSELEAMDAESPGDALDDTRLEQLSRLAGQVPVQLRRIKRALRATGVERTARPELFRSLDTLNIAARSLATRVAEVRAKDLDSPLARLPAEAAHAIVRHNGPLYPGASWYVLDEGHIDAIDVAYEDDALGLSIHDESVDPDVERDPAETILVVKSSAKVEVPDQRFAFLGPVGRNVWILPEGQPEAEAAGVLWPGIATAEVEAGVFVGDTIDIRFHDVLGPNGFSLFESPEDETSAPNVLVDSENGLPDTLTTPVGIHRHANWAFESPGLYALRVQAWGRLAALPGTPWVSSPNILLKFVVLP